MAAVLPDWWQYIPRFVSRQKVSSLQFTNLTSESNETQYDKIIEGKLSENYRSAETNIKTLLEETIAIQLIKYTVLLKKFELLMAKELLLFSSFSVINYLNESHSDVVFGPCRRDISIAVEGLRMPYMCTTFDPEVEVFKFQILPALSDFIEAMRKFVYGQCRRGGDGEYKTIIYEGNKGTQHSTTQ